MPKRPITVFVVVLRDDDGTLVAVARSRDAAEKYMRDHQQIRCAIIEMETLD